MTLEAVLASLHLLAILTLVVFLSSQAALCRIEWMNAAVVERLARLDLIYGMAAVAVLGSGLARVFWGIKGASWYATQPMLHIKVTLFVVMALLSIAPTLAFRRWRRNLRASGALPGAAEVAVMGFSRKENAPMRVASTAVSMVACPLIMMTGMVSKPLLDHSLSKVTPSVSGIQMSSSTRSYPPALRAARAWVAFSARSTLCPSSLRISDSKSRMPCSSSTTKMFAMYEVP